MNREITQASKIKNSYYFELDSHLKLVGATTLMPNIIKITKTRTHKNMDRFCKFGK